MDAFAWGRFVAEFGVQPLGCSGATDSLKAEHRTLAIKFFMQYQYRRDGALQQKLVLIANFARTP